MSKYASWPTSDAGNVVGSRLANEIEHRFGGSMRQLAFDQQAHAALAELLATTGETFNVKSFGAVGDGVADDTAAIQAAVDAVTGSGVVLGRPGETYRLTDAITASDKTVYFDFTGCTIVQEGANRTLVYDAGVDFIRDVTTVSAGNRTLEMTTTDVAVGDVIKLVCDDRLEGTRPASAPNDYRRGQYLTVADVDATHVTFNETLRYTYTTNVRCAKLSGHTCRWYGGNITYTSDSTQTSTCLDIYNAYNPIVEAITFGTMPFISVSLRGCYRYTCRDLTWARSLYDPPNFGHGVSDWSCYGGTVMAMGSGHVRHAFTTNMQAVAAEDDDIWAFGPSYGGHIFAQTASGQGAAGIDTHHGCEDFTVIGGLIADRQNTGIQIRGRRITVIGAKVYNGTDGILCWSEADMAEADYTEDVTFVSCEVVGCTELPVSVIRARNVTFTNPVITGAELLFLSVKEADVRLVSPTVTVTGNSDSDERLIVLTDEGVLDIDGKARITVSNHTGSGAGLVAMSGTGLSVLRADRIQLTANSGIALTLFLEASSVDCTYQVRELEISGPSSFTQDSGDFTDSYVLWRGAGQSSTPDQTITDGQVLTLRKAWDAHILQVLNAAGAVAVGGFPEGKFPGQRLSLWSRAGTNAITIPDGDGSNGVNIKNFGSLDVVLDEGRATVTYVWSGSSYEWVQIAGLGAALPYIHVTGDIELDGALNHDGTTVGLFGVTPTTRPTALTAADATAANTGDSATDDVIDNMRTRIGELETKLTALGALAT